jgi:hypothetical protein
MKFMKFFEKPKQEEDLKNLTDEDLLNKFNDIRIQFDGIVKRRNRAHNSSSEFANDPNSIERTDNETARVRQKLKKIEDEVRRRKLTFPDEI